MAQFMLLLYGDPTRWQGMLPPELDAAYRKYMTWGSKGRQGGYVTAANKLVDDAGRVVRGQKPVVSDGPYIETKEVLGGYYIIEAANYEDAVRRCLDHPHLQFDGTIEVRQVEQLPS